MMRLLLFSILGILIEGVSIYGFITISKSDWDVPGKQIVIILFLISIAILFWISVRFFSIYEQLLFSGFLTAGFIVVYQLLGFTFFPGLVKDISFFSFQHFRVTLIFAVIVFVFFNLIGIAILVLRKKI